MVWNFMRIVSLEITKLIFKDSRKIMICFLPFSHIQGVVKDMLPWIIYQKLNPICLGYYFAGNLIKELIIMRTVSERDTQA